MKNHTITFVGGGNMARSLIGGLITGGCPAQRIWVSDPDTGKLQVLAERFGVNSTTSNPEAAAKGDVIVLAVKPQTVRAAAGEIAATVQTRRPLLMSIAAGIRVSALERWLGDAVAIVRTMPNTPALVQSSATALFANVRVSEAQRNLAESIMRAVGLTLWLDQEEHMDAVTALSGSGPAYFFLVMEALQSAGRQLGLPRETARLLTLETAFGAAKLALESEDEVSALRARVTSPGGTTERAVAVLQQGGLERLFAEALRAARDRATELADALGDN